MASAQQPAAAPAAPKPKLKVVCRKLPPGLDEPAFRAQLEKLELEGKYDWLTFYQGKVRWGGARAQEEARSETRSEARSQRGRVSPPSAPLAP
jgi:hypothetical protein